MVRKILILLLTMVYFNIATAQSSQLIKGIVTDKNTTLPLEFAQVSILNSNPVIGSITDSVGQFVLSNVPTGRYDVEVLLMGYDKMVLREVVLSTGKQTQLSIDLVSNVTQLNEVVVKPALYKHKSLNLYSTVSARMLSVEEASRYAGGFDDPARLASAFAGVASNSGSNGIIVRGNAPRYLLWRMEGVEIPNPNHFNDLRSFGGGILTALSSQMLGNSDFFTGAFPAEYNNALSGVFDMNLRKGNIDNTERTLQFGLIGLETSQEGPFKKGGSSSYVYNHRYSTLGLLAPLLPDGAETINYQDLSFKMNFPSKKAGTFSIWGLGFIDNANNKPKKDSADRKYYDDSQENNITMNTGALGLNHKIFLKNNTYLQTVLAATINDTDWQTKSLIMSEQLVPFSNISNTNWDYSLTSFVNKKFKTRHTNRTGVRVRYMNYDLQLNRAPKIGEQTLEIVNANGSSILSSVFSNSNISLTNRLKLNAGITALLFSLSNKYSIEPRVGITQNVGDRASVGFAYGLHSRLENLNLYFNNSLTTSDKAVNKNLDFTKAHHFVLSYDVNLTDLLHFKIEPYYQILFDVPVVNGTSFSTLNHQSDWFFAQKLVNKGEGKNYGVDVTLEKYMSYGFYFMTTASIFDSKYKSGDGVWRDTRFNRNYVANLLAGKEWKVGKMNQNVFSINGRATFQGGERYSPFDVQATAAKKEIVYDETRAFTEITDPMMNLHLTISYKKNKKKNSRELTLKIVNLTQQPDFYGYQYNFRTGGIDEDIEVILLPNLSYKIQF